MTNVSRLDWRSLQRRYKHDEHYELQFQQVSATLPLLPPAAPAASQSSRPPSLPSTATVQGKCGYFFILHFTALHIVHCSYYVLGRKFKTRCSSETFVINDVGGKKGHRSVQTTCTLHFIYSTIYCSINPVHITINCGDFTPFMSKSFPI